MAWWATNALFLRYLTPANFFSRIEFQYVNTYILCLSIYAFIHTILQFEYSTLLSVFYFHMSEIKFQMHSPSSPLNNSWMLSLDLKVKHLYGAVDSPKLKIKKKLRSYICSRIAIFSLSTTSVKTSSFPMRPNTDYRHFSVMFQLLWRSECFHSWRSFSLNISCF